MEIDLYKDLSAFNALTPEEQAAEAERIRSAAVGSNGFGTIAPEPAPEPVPAFVAPELAPEPVPTFIAPLAFVDSPGSVILRAEDILPDDELEPEPKPEPQPKSVETAGRKAKMDDQLNPSGPLIDISIANVQSNGTLVACPTCGSESEGQDLFCIVCGSFLNESDVGVEVEAGPACIDCGASIEPGEIFCPSCGSALPG
jgi:DNA-directed RNA polymerase subunit RPC12/RpoP